MLTKKTNWSELTKLNINDLDDCISLQEVMLINMQKNKEHTCGYIAKREEKDFEDFLKNGEMFGIKDTITDKLIAMVRIEPLNFEKITKYLSYNGTFSICDELVNIYKKYNGVYLSCLMTDLNNKNVGLGQHIVYRTELYVKNVLQKDYSLCEIHIKNRSCYRLLKTFFHFAISNRIETRVCVNSKKTKIPLFHLCSIYNEQIETKLKNAIIAQTATKMIFTDNIIKNMFQNCTQDQILNKSQLLVFNYSKISKVEISFQK